LTLLYPKSDDAPTDDRQIVDELTRTIVVESPY
jgi:hypothetical protein